MTPEEQLEQWVKGISVHNPTRDECCPDFSCCRPNLMAPEEQRRRFAEHPEQRGAMLGMFLGAMLADSKLDDRAQVVGDTQGVA